jgi:hypothetical protein
MLTVAADGRHQSFGRRCRQRGGRRDHRPEQGNGVAVHTLGATNVSGVNFTVTTLRQSRQRWSGRASISTQRSRRGRGTATTANGPAAAVTQVDRGNINVAVDGVAVAGASDPTAVSSCLLNLASGHFQRCNCKRKPADFADFAISRGIATGTVSRSRPYAASAECGRWADGNVPLSISP